jgi:hypothetical protein
MKKIIFNLFQLFKKFIKIFKKSHFATYYKVDGKAISSESDEVIIILNKN